jgi:hypothetical protein
MKVRMIIIKKGEKKVNECLRLRQDEHHKRTNMRGSKLFLRSKIYTTGYFQIFSTLIAIQWKETNKWSEKERIMINGNNFGSHERIN